METLDIRSCLPHFRLISKVSAASPTGIAAEAIFNGDPLYTGLEAMAQTAALHARHNLRFERHAFLLSVQHCRMPPIERLKGVFRITAGLRSRSSEAFVYRVVAEGPDGAGFNSVLLIGTRVYDGRFRKAGLTALYQNIWAQLREA